MKARAPAGAAAQVRMAWMLLALLAVIGYAAIVEPAERRLSAVLSHARELYELSNRNDRLLRNIGSIQQARDRVRRDLTQLAGQRATGKAGLSILRLLQSESVRNHVVIAGVAPGDSANLAGQDTHGDTVAISLHGRYRDVVTSIADLSRHDALVEIRDVALVRSGGASAAPFPSVDATIHATLYDDPAALLEDVQRAETPSH
jgi:Tfp pilus assembly protein PilO